MLIMTILDASTSVIEELGLGLWGGEECKKQGNAETQLEISSQLVWKEIWQVSKEQHWQLTSLVQAHSSLSMNWKKSVSFSDTSLMTIFF
jgi:hypothetical protein